MLLTLKKKDAMNRYAFRLKLLRFAILLPTTRAVPPRTGWYGFNFSCMLWAIFEAAGSKQSEMIALLLSLPGLAATYRSK